MNINKHDAETEMEMNMTPMIDVVFLLIIFFMIITDLTQQELEDLELPLAIKAVEDKPNPEDRRPILNILQSGEIIVKRETYYDPEDADNWDTLEGYLSGMAQLMDKEPVPEVGKDLPSDPVLIRSDEFALFKGIQKVMERCGKEGIQIWKVELAASMPQPDE